MRNDTLDSMLQRNNPMPAAFGMRPSFGQGAQGSQVKAVTCDARVTCVADV